MENEGDPYAVLGVLPSIDEVALRAVYRALLKKYHPDVFAGSKAEAQSKTAAIIAAYKILSDPAKRSAYDRSRAARPSDGQTSDRTNRYAYDFDVDWSTVQAAPARRRSKKGLVAGLGAFGILIALVAWWGGRSGGSPAVDMPEAQRRDVRGSENIPPEARCAHPPLNGEMLFVASRLALGRHAVEIDNQTAGNAIVKIKSAESKELLVAFVVAPKARAGFDRLPDGNYTVQYALSTAFAPDCLTPLRPYALEEVPQDLSMYARYEDQKIFFRRMTYTIFSERNPAGNLKPHPISGLQFDAN